MSQPSFESDSLAAAPSVLTKRSPWTAYNALLAISLAALLTGIACLVLEWLRYGASGPTGG